MDNELIAKIVDSLAYTSMREMIVADEYGLEINELEDIMTNAGYERCSVCETWCETGELVDDDGLTCPCENCREDSERS